MTKPTKWLCAQRRLRSAWISAQSDQSLRCPYEVSLGPESSLGEYSFCWFCHVAAHLRNTLTLKSEDGSFETSELFTYPKNLDLYSKVFGIQRFTVNRVHVAEITLKYEANVTEFTTKFFAKPVIINGNTLQLTPKRKMKDIVRNPVTKVLIFEASFQLRNGYILQKLAQLGQLQSDEIYMHKYRGTDIYNRVRSVNFLKIDKPIPTTMFVKGNRVRLQHEDQERTPICGICRVCGHYRDVPNNNNKRKTCRFYWCGQ